MLVAFYCVGVPGCSLEALCLPNCRRRVLRVVIGNSGCLTCLPRTYGLPVAPSCRQQGTKQERLGSVQKSNNVKMERATNESDVVTQNYARLYS